MRTTLSEPVPSFGRPGRDGSLNSRPTAHAMVRAMTRGRAVFPPAAGPAIIPVLADGRESRARVTGAPRRPSLSGRDRLCRSGAQ
jgi:hypothetical protein